MLLKCCDQSINRPGDAGSVLQSLNLAARRGVHYPVLRQRGGAPPVIGTQQREMLTACGSVVAAGAVPKLILPYFVIILHGAFIYF